MRNQLLQAGELIDGREMWDDLAIGYSRVWGSSRGTVAGSWKWICEEVVVGFGSKCFG
jgi:hypothetical protein